MSLGVVESMRVVRVVLTIMLFPALAVGEPAAPAPIPAPQLSHPPVFLRLDPYRDIYRPVVVKSGQSIRFVVYAQDPAGAVLEYFARGLPPGSIFDPETQTFSWIPGPAVEGLFTPIFIASNGDSEATLLVQIEVSRNRSPRLESSQLRFDVGQEGSARISATDPDGDTISYSASGLPGGASLSSTTGELRFRPKAADVGRHSFVVFATDGELRSSNTYELDVHDQAKEMLEQERNEWESFLQPGLGYVFYLPGDFDTYAPFQGVDIQLSVVSFIHRNDNRGPSHGRFYISAQVLESTDRGLGPLFIYAAGMTLSIERNPKRSWLIPHYGVEIGGMTQEQMGSQFQSLFFGGAHLYASRNLFINVEAGYLLVPARMEDLAGFTTGANVEFSLW